MRQPVTGRFAPTPSGRLHLGNILCAMLAYLSVRREGGRFLLRIEDLDVPRCPRALAKQAIDDLTWLGFTWDEPPLYQSERTAVYEQFLRALEEKGLIYPCFCTRAQLHASLAPNLGDAQPVYPGTCRGMPPEEIAERSKLRAPALRLRVPDEEVAFTDGLCGDQRGNPARDCGDFIVRRSDGLFAYQLAVVVDDALSGVTQVVRGRDILASTPQQMVLLRELGFPTPDYVHIPLLTDAQGRRLAKRDKDLDLTALARHMTPEAILGALACSAGLLDEPRPVTLEALIPLFDWAKVRRDDLRLPSGLGVEKP